eukprot:5839189-Prymnesium_polylepis.1
MRAWPQIAMRAWPQSYGKRCSAAPLLSAGGAPPALLRLPPVGCWMPRHMSARSRSLHTNSGGQHAHSPRARRTL